MPPMRSSRWLVVGKVLLAVVLPTAAFALLLYLAGATVLLSLMGAAVGHRKTDYSGLMVILVVLILAGAAAIALASWVLERWIFGPRGAEGSGGLRPWHVRVGALAVFVTAPFATFWGWREIDFRRNVDRAASEDWMARDRAIEDLASSGDPRALPLVVSLANRPWDEAPSRWDTTRAHAIEALAGIPGGTPALLALAGDPNWRTRAVVANSLPRLAGDAAGWQTLRALAARDPEASVRSSAVRALGSGDLPFGRRYDAGHALVERLSDPDPQVRLQAADALAISYNIASGYQTVVGVVVDASLPDDVRWQAISTLARLKDRRAVPLLCAIALPGETTGLVPETYGDEYVQRAREALGLLSERGQFTAEHCDTAAVGPKASPR